MRAIAIGLLGLCGVAVAVLAGIYLTMARPIEKAFAPATPQNARVDLLAEQPDALILLPFVTGDVPRLVTASRLQDLAPQLWYTDNINVGNLIGGVLVGMMGLPPITEIGTGFRGGVATRSHQCMTVGCQNWPNEAAPPWGLANLRGQGDALGPEVRQEHLSFSDYAAYQTAHAAALADPLQWLAKPGAETLLPADDGLRLVVVRLPSLLLPGIPGDGLTEDPVQAKALADMTAALLEGTSGTVQGAFGTSPMPLWVQKNGSYLYDANGSRALPDLVVYQRGLRLMVPQAELPSVLARARALNLPPPDLGLVETAIADAFAAWGEDRTCLPDCGKVAEQMQIRTEVNTGGEPFWVLDIWHIPKALPDD